MNDVQELLGELKVKGWTLAAVGDELGVAANTVVRWHSGDRYPANVRAVILVLEGLLKRQRVPKRRRYTKSPLARES